MMECIGCRESWLGGLAASSGLSFSSCSSHSSCKELDGRIVFSSRRRMGDGGCRSLWQFSSSSVVAMDGRRDRRRPAASRYDAGKGRDERDDEYGGDVRERVERVERVEWPRHVDRISSVINPFVRQCLRLRQSRSYRNETGLALVVGRVPLSEIISASRSSREDDRRRGDVEMEVLLLLEGLPVPQDMPARQVIYVTASVMRKVSGVENAEGVEMMGVLRKPTTFVSLGSSTVSSLAKAQRWCPTASRILALDGVQDPGNLGTLLRTAAALGWDGVFLLPGCCDPFNEKAIRASRGASFHIPVAVGEWSHFRSMLSRRPVACYSGEPCQPWMSSSSPMRLLADAVRKKIEMASLEGSVCLILGSEGQGLSAEARELSEPLAVPMMGHLESLNVAVAGGILMYLLKGWPEQRESQEMGGRGMRQMHSRRP